MGTHIHQPDFNAKGDLLAASADNTLQILSVGADGEVLTADSGQTSGLKWAAAAGGSSTPRATISWSMDINPAQSAGGSWETATSGATTNGFGTSGGTWSIATGTTSGNKGAVGARYVGLTAAGFALWNRNPIWWCNLALQFPATGDGEGMVTMGGAPDYLFNSYKTMGFKWTIVSGTRKLFAHNSNESASTDTDVSASSNTITSNTNTVPDRLACVMTSGTNIKFYVNGTLAATHTTNLPSGSFTDYYHSQMFNKTNSTSNYQAHLGASGYSYEMF